MPTFDFKAILIKLQSPNTSNVQEENFGEITQKHFSGQTLLAS